eukprot:TRINITY_DN6265_c0_g1_i1.p1 TRINITY_DN6265_c0_g1~~TRINITY_DN6265_c0_g1_i1.p1  ORF type:complete len:423 (-),score=74.06 TRINITY_DN6265_c0_g1_i1:202-1470(-)
MWNSLYLLCLALTLSHGDIRKSLKFVNVLFRHGDRTPVAFYPNDPHKDPSEWPVGPGQLTPRGMKMQYELGKYLRSRYAGFLSEAYKKDDILVRSTDVDRTLMSALSNLAGLYPPKESQVWNPNLLWQPVPVHTIPGPEDVLLGSHFDCERYGYLKNKTVYDNPYFKALNAKYAKDFAYMSHHSGSTIDNIVNADYIRDTLFIEELYNKSLPEWTKRVYPEPLNTISALSFLSPTWTEELKRLKSGPLITQLLENFEGALDPKGPSFIMYSGHDTTVAALLNSLGVFPAQIPPYASCVIMEVHSTSSQSLSVRFQYRNDSTRAPYDLIIPGCKKPLCPLETFKTLTRPLRLSMEAWTSECANMNRSSSFFLPQKMDLIMTVSILISALFVILLASAVSLAVVRRLSKRKSEPGYVSINQVPH